MDTVTLYARAAAVAVLADPDWTATPPPPDPSTGRVDGWVGVVIAEDVWEEHRFASDDLGRARRHLEQAQARLEDAKADLEQAVAAALPTTTSHPRPVTTARCGCGHRLDDHGPGGCAADDEAAMGGCDCPGTRDQDRGRPLPPLVGPGGTHERPFA